MTVTGHRTGSSHALRPGTMAIAAAWLRLELRRRLRPLIVLALLVGLATATILTAVAGARRGESAIERLRAVTLPADAVVLPNDSAFDWNKIRALPGVAAVAGFAVAPFFVEELPGYAGYLPPADGEAMRTVERPVVLEGRLPDPSRADEVVISGRFSGSYGLGVGDALTFRLMTVAEAGNPNFDGVPHGPLVPARIVGVIRSPWYSDAVGGRGDMHPSAGLFAAHPKNFLGAGTYGFANALVRLDRGESGLPAFRKSLSEVTGRTDIEIWNGADNARRSQRVNTYESLALGVFALAALVAALVLVGQSVARYATANVSDLQVLRASGITTPQVMAAASAGPFLASVAGASAGVGGAVLGSLWMPIGAASLLEPAPGLDVDVLVLAVGWVIVPLLVLAGALAAARLAIAAARSEAPPRRSAVARAVARLGLPVPLVIGTRFALEPGRGRTSVPVRPALFGAVAGVLGVLASFTFAAGVADAAGNPARFGQTFQVATYFGEGGQDWAPAEQAMAVIARDPDVLSVNDARVSVAAAHTIPNPDTSADPNPGTGDNPSPDTGDGPNSDAGADPDPGTGDGPNFDADDVSVTVYSYHPVGAPFPVVLVSGRMPESSGEIVLAPTSARDLQAEVGSTVRLAGKTAPRDLRVTGIGFVPHGSHNDYDAGAWTSADGFRALFGADFKYHQSLIALRPGADMDALQVRLTTAVKAIKDGEKVAFGTQDPPTQLAEVQDMRILPLFLGGFLALLAVGAVGHALATAIRRRRHEIAVMRALGLTRTQSRWVVVTQASLLALVGLAFGVPLGLALGRTLWRVVADHTPLFYQPPIALWALLLVGPGALLVANLLAAWPSRLVTRFGVGQILRAE
ncbi:ABC transporter permease [Streptosporangium sp. 'caverna']|uniref:ABC transporter permease n=1 Tax=Streptosporangium sp. 'caverna' TaxID=2202249 RepID=UPI000D7DE82E|nr:ABC transporter permease [Streptosporangium sp. 'caverna']AWS40522.1 hypothetical protein DKM19_03390 [Streptosporangium sp. 'caverna']